MPEDKNRGVITLIEELISDLKSLVSEIEPIINQKSTDISTVKRHVDYLLKKMANITEKTNLTHRLIQGVINSIHSSRKELKLSVDGLLKKTGMQLQKITTTTEEATNKILDVAEKLDNDQNKIIESLDELKTISDSNIMNEKVEEIKKKVYVNQDAAFTIIDYLQFQDITAQQIAGAYSLLSDTERTLLYVSNLLKEFDLGDNNPEFTLPEIDKKAFNADALFNDKAGIQNLIDDLFETGNTNIEIPNEETDTKLKELPASHANVNNDENEDFDIDALFNSNNSKSKEEITNQDDIDKLFS
ncbi:MAG: hypothetical protein M0Q94_12705 [Candidatus Cloacimonetes bacterium]|jgi:hypothetical protein|nr:hypothetical protein [Candidatus Cloacimonadota bacterium]